MALSRLLVVPAVFCAALLGSPSLTRRAEVRRSRFRPARGRRGRNHDEIQKLLKTYEEKVTEHQDRKTKEIMEV